MRLYQSIIAYGALVVGLSGCPPPDYHNATHAEAPAKVSFQHIEPFARVPMTLESGMAVALGDVDGDLDLIVGSRGVNDQGHSGKLYLLKNDGKGNFSQ